MRNLLVSAALATAILSAPVVAPSLAQAASSRVEQSTASLSENDDARGKLKAQQKDQRDKLKAQQKDQRDKLKGQQKDQRTKLAAEQKLQRDKLYADQRAQWQKLRQASNDDTTTNTAGRSNFARR